MKKTEWFNRNFPPQTDNGTLPCIIERLDGTAARLQAKMSKTNTDLTAAASGKWSIKKEIGHLLDAEPLWYERMLQIIGGEKDLKVADLSNRKTHETDHDSRSIDDLITDFEAERAKLVAVLEQTSEADLEKAAKHPRLGSPMKVIDLAYFVAEHDDHHLAQISFLIKNR
jgi:uncharacterized damage-inducible protein DinB